MIVRAVRLAISTPRGRYGFFFPFSRNLTVVRGNNSSGKSTFFNCLLYALGMEEIIGGKGPHVLPYAVREYFDDGADRVNIVSSEIYVEIENRSGKIVTLRRPIRDDSRDSKLVEVANGSLLIGRDEVEFATSLYLHDPGSAQKQEGFYHFLDSFLDLELPRVATTSGPETKLYLQAIFAAHAVEQKRGWTDYIANIPFYGIRDARTRVAEYILGLNVFETTSLRNRLNAASSAIDLEWRQVVESLNLEAGSYGFVFEGIPAQPSSSFKTENAKLIKLVATAQIQLSEYVSQLFVEHEALAAVSANDSATDSSGLMQRLEAAEEEVRSLSALYDSATSNLSLQKAALAEYQVLFQEASADLDRNKVARKLQELGARHAIELATGQCPTCHQPIEDSLLRESLIGHQMDLDTNIGYLGSQVRMLQRQIAGVTDSIRQATTSANNVASQLAAKRDYAIALRDDLGSNALQSKAAVRRQVQIEVEIEALQKLEETTAQRIAELKVIADRLAENQLARSRLPPRQHTESDESKISLFEKNFRANAGSFGYESVSNIGEIEIDPGSLVPGLAQIELREIVRKKKADIRGDSSASDFVRLIWSYLLGLYQTSANPHTPGNHLGLLMLDEPGQHSMRWESQRELLLRLADERNLQSIVAASFDESESVFSDVTENVAHRLISWDGKLIKPLDSGLEN